MYFWVKSKVLDTGGGGGFDAGYQAILDYATGLGFTLPSAACQILQNQLYIDIKNIGWGDFRHFACYANDGASQDFACINWANTGLNVTRVNAPTYTNKEGFKTNGTTQYLDCGVLMTSGTPDNRMFGLRLFSLDTFAIAFNHIGGANDLFARYRGFMGATFQSRNYNGTVDNITFTAGSKYRIFSRNVSSEYKAFTPSAVTVTRTRSGGNVASKPLCVGYSPTTAYEVTNVTHSFEGDGLTDTQIIDLETYLDNYMAAL